MSKEVQLKCNMIFGGAFYPRGAVMEADRIPPNLRRQEEYVGEPGSVEPLYSSQEDESGSSASGEEEEEEEGTS